MRTKTLKDKIDCYDYDGIGIPEDTIKAKHVKQAIEVLKEIERQKHLILSDLSRYAEHLKQKYYIGTMSPFHQLTARINNQLKKEQ